jgi:hypothetical protein
MYYEGDVESLQVAYDELIRALCWERDRTIKLAEELAAEGKKEEAHWVLNAQAEYVREQAVR